MASSRMAKQSRDKPDVRLSAASRISASRRMVFLLRTPLVRGGGLDAGRIFGSGRAFFLHIARGAGAGEPSVEEDSGACAGSPGGNESQLWDALCKRRTSLDPAGAIAERLAAAGVLRH